MMNLAKVKTNSELVKTAKKTYNQFYSEAYYHDYVNCYDLHKTFFGIKKSSAVMQSERITLCEINASLWVKAVNSAIDSITLHTYSHYVIVQKFINYLLNADSTKNFGLIENYFWKLLLTHPPSPEMFDYYWQIIFDHFVCLNGKETKDQTLFFIMLEAVTNCLKVKTSADGNNYLKKSAIGPELSHKNGSNFTYLDSKLSYLELRESLNIISDKTSSAKVSQKQISFNELPWKEKIKRCLIVLNFIYNILETDFIFWLNKKESKKSIDSKPLMSYLFWKDQRDFGVVNKEIRKLFHLYELTMHLDFQNIHVIHKLVILIGEIIRWSDSTEEIKYPFMGTNYNNFSRELSFILYQHLKENKNNVKENKLIVNFKPPWLRLILCSHLLTSITKRECHPELTGVCDILEFIGHTKNKNSSFKKTPTEFFDSTNVLMQKRKKFQNINAKLRNGKTHLHLACENNDIEKIKMLLTLPLLDVNAVDRNGWTALHTAAYKGKATIVQELLLFCPNTEGKQKSINTRAKGPKNTTPLMSAASRGHAKICKLLLDHSGSILLDDVNESNLTALELSHNAGVKRILKYYGSNSSWTQNCVKDISFDSDFRRVVIKLCLEMIQAYFSTYKTWDFNKAVNKSENTVKKNQIAFDFDFKQDYMPYSPNTKRNIIKLKNLLPKLQCVEEFVGLSDLYRRIFLIK